LTSALEGGERSVSRPSHTLPLGKTRYPLYRRLGGPQGRSGEVRKISPPPGFDPQTIQPIGSCYTMLPGPQLKHIAQYYVTLKCCVGLCILVVCNTEKHNGMYQNKINTM